MYIQIYLKQSSHFISLKAHASAVTSSNFPPPAPPPSQSADDTDCRGELASVDDMGRFPVKNDIGLPLANPPPPRDYKLKDAKRFFRGFFRNLSDFTVDKYFRIKNFCAVVRAAAAINTS